jgi:hypothetical protein
VSAKWPAVPPFVPRSSNEIAGAGTAGQN